ncbi:unnamed protein product [Blepharisma stoltei]|uniref:ATP synthase F0 subunit 8 n=1 Tax=Blepharisma stoltei TaxID=1481888 RepID=A0AAU9JCY5_9CILI|nr:unnamed protein product [Blepharisma stoltei]
MILSIIWLYYWFIFVYGLPISIYLSLSTPQKISEYARSLEEINQVESNSENSIYVIGLNNTFQTSLSNCNENPFIIIDETYSIKLSYEIQL